MEQPYQMLNIDSFIRLKQIEIQTSSKKLIRTCLQRTEHLLSNPPFTFNRPEFITLAAKDIVLHKKRIFDTAEESCEDNVERNLKAEELYKMVNDVHNAQSEGFLVLGIDTSSSLNQKTFKRINYLGSVAEIYPGLSGMFLDRVIQNIKVTDYQSCSDSVSKFFMEFVFKCKQAIVLLNGYVSSEGQITFMDKQISVDTFITNVIEHYKSIMLSQRLMPILLDIVFVCNKSAQSLSNSEGILQTSDIHVVSVSIDNPVHSCYVVRVKNKTENPNFASQSNIFSGESSGLQNWNTNPNTANLIAQFRQEEEKPGMDYIDY